MFVSNGKARNFLLVAGAVIGMTDVGSGRPATV